MNNSFKTPDDSIATLRSSGATANGSQSSSYALSFSFDEEEKYRRPKNWEEFKKEYYKLEKKICKELENMRHQLSEFSKQLSLTE